MNAPAPFNTSSQNFRKFFVSLISPTFTQNNGRLLGSLLTHPRFSSDQPAARLCFESGRQTFVCNNVVEIQWKKIQQTAFLNGKTSWKTKTENMLFCNSVLKLTASLLEWSSQLSLLEYKNRKQCPLDMPVESHNRTHPTTVANNLTYLIIPQIHNI